MRLWHYDLIDVLPRKQLQGQWRECLAIAGSIKKNGTPNHLLVNYVLNYDIKVFKDFSKQIYNEMLNRGLKASKERLKSILDMNNNVNIICDENTFKEHNNEYLTICYYNLKEKYICGGITDDEWLKIDNRYNKKKEN